MSGSVVVEGSVSQSAGATAHGGLLVIDGDAAARCGISMKGVDIVVGGSVGHMSAFMAQAGRLVVCGDAGEALGDSIYEARLYVRGTVAVARRRLRREGDARRARRAGARRCSSAAGIDDDDPPTSAATARPAALPLPRRQRRGVLMTAPDGWHARACASRPPSTATRSPRSSAPPRGHLRHPRLGRQAASCRTSTTCCSSARACRATRWRATASAATPTSTLGDALRQAAAAPRRSRSRSPG